MTFYRHNSGQITERNIADDDVAVVVIDPEDAEQVKALCAHWEAVKYGTTGEVPMSLFELHMQSALREFANPKPPKPDEPRGLGAVVEDAAGFRWVRTPDPMQPWHSRPVFLPQFRAWRDVDAVRVVFEGVTA